MNQTTGVRSGILLAVIGLWLVMRSTHGDAGTKRTLINHILGTNVDGTPYTTQQAATTIAQGVTPGQTAAGVTPGQKAVTPAQAQASAAQAIQDAGGVQIQAPTLDPSVVAGGFASATPTGPTQRFNVRPIRGQAQIQAALDKIAAAGNTIGLYPTVNKRGY